MPIPFSATPEIELPSRSGECMHSLVEKLRSQGPAVAVLLPEGLGAWSVTRGDIVSFLLTHKDVSRDIHRAVPSYQPGEIRWLSPWVDLESMATKDGAEHARLRRTVTPSLTYRKVQKLLPVVEAGIRELAADLRNSSPDELVDVHARFSYPVPTHVICDLFGIPDSLRPEVLRVFRLVARTDLSEAESEQLNADLVEAMRQLIAIKKETPEDDFTSILIAESEREADPLSEHELVSTLLLMIGGGSQTTINLIDHAIADVAGRHELIDRAAADPSIWRSIIEEALRKHCPVMNLPMRWALRDIDLGEGVVIKAGDAILLNYAGHGRDPDVNSDPLQLDVDRSERHDLAFGLGVHRCPGSHLALLETEVALREFFAAFPRAEVVGEVDEYAGPTFIGNDLTQLPMRLQHDAV